jgi:hypothetical protein
MTTVTFIAGLFFGAFAKNIIVGASQFYTMHKNGELNTRTKF